MGSRWDALVISRSAYTCICLSLINVSRYTAYSISGKPGTPLYPHGLPGLYHVPMRLVTNRHVANAEVMVSLGPLNRRTREGTMGSLNVIPVKLRDFLHLWA